MISFPQIVATYPVLNPSLEYLKKTLIDILSGLHQAGFQVVIITTGNNVINRKIYRMLTRKTDENLEIHPIIKHPCDPNGQLILSFDTVGLMQTLRNDFFRREEFQLEFRKEEESGSISWVLLGKLPVFPGLSTILLV